MNSGDGVIASPTSNGPHGTTIFTPPSHPVCNEIEEGARHGLRNPIW
jgi:hypothetical protein